MVLPRLEEPVVQGQIHLHDQDVGHRRGSLTPAEDLGHGVGIGQAALVEHQPQCVIHEAFSLPGRQEEDRQVILDHAAGPPVL
jgi:hypothetical protein